MTEKVVPRPWSPAARSARPQALTPVEAAEYILAMSLELATLAEQGHLPDDIVYTLRMAAAAVAQFRGQRLDRAETMVRVHGDPPP